jgi:hypothetical protein
MHNSFHFSLDAPYRSFHDDLQWGDRPWGLLSKQPKQQEKETAMATRNGAAFSEIFEQAIENFTGALQAGAKFQQDVGNWFTGALAPATGSAQDWQRRTQAIWAQALPTAQRNADEYLRMFDSSYHTSIDLMKKALNVGRVNSPMEAQAKAQRLLDESMEVIRNNAKAMAEANVRVFEAWADVVRNGAKSAAEAAQAAQEAAQEATQAARATASSAASTVRNAAKGAQHRKPAAS